MRFLLDLSRPQRAVRTMAEALANGEPVLSLVGEGQDGLALELEQALADTGRDVRIISAGHQGLKDLARVLNLQNAPRPSEIGSLKQFRRTVLQLSPTCEDLRQWAIDSVRLQAQAPAPGGLAIWIVERDDWAVSAQAHPRCRRLCLADSIGQGEMRAYAASLFVERTGPGPTHYFEALAREIAGPEFRLLERLADCSDDELLDIRATLQAMAPLRASTTSRSAFASSIDLADSGDAAMATRLAQRIWRAQLQTILPALEFERSRFLQPYVRDLTRAITAEPPNDPIASIPDDVEWGSAWHYLRRAGVRASVVTAAGIFRAARNELAHRRALGLADLQRLFAEAAGAFGSRWAA